MTVNLDDTTRCPTAEQCETCGSEYDLTVVTAGTPVGVYCLTLCVADIDAGRPPTDGYWSGTVRRVIDHCEHLGIDAEQMAAALAAEEGDDQR